MIRTIQLTFTSRFRKHSGWQVFIMRMIHLLKYVSSFPDRLDCYIWKVQSIGTKVIRVILFYISRFFSSYTIFQLLVMMKRTSDWITVNILYVICIVKDRWFFFFSFRSFSWFNRHDSNEKQKFVLWSIWRPCLTPSRFSTLTLCKKYSGKT